MKENITQETGEDFVKRALYRYGIEVIENRALPRVEDGLKPVQRLLIWAAHGLKSDVFVRCSKICGDTTGKYHPHGDTAAYLALVKMVEANDRYGGFEGMGNFGAIDAPPGAPRYTQARLSQLLQKISTDTPDLASVPYVPNYDETQQQPAYLPMVLPYLLLIGSQGIAPGITSYIPKFNLVEVCRAVVRYLETQDLDKAIKCLTAPDGHRCRLLSTRKEVAVMLETGEGTLEYECLHTVEKATRGFRLVVSGYAPDFNLDSFLRRCGKLQDEDLIEVVRNETSAKNGDRIVVDFKDESVYERKLRALLREKVAYKLNVLFERNGRLRPEMCGVGKILHEWIVVRRKTVRDTLQAEIDDLLRQIVREQLKLRALINLDKIVAALKAPGDFKQNLVDSNHFSLEQAEIVAGMRVESLKKTNSIEVEARVKNLQEQAGQLNEKLGNVDVVIVSQIKELVKWAGKQNPVLLERQTQISW